MLDEHADEAFERAEDGAVQHHRALARVVFGDVAGVQALWQVRVVLQGTALPVTAEAVAQGELDLRAVEGALARLVFPLQARFVQGVGQCTFGTVPQLFGTDTLGRTGGQLHGHIGEAEVVVHVQGQLDEVGGFLLHLIFGAEDVRVVLHEATHAHDAVQGAGRLVTVAGTELGQAQRQVAVALQALVEHLHVARAVHRFNRKITAFRRSGEHVLGVVGPVAGALPEDAVDNLRGLDFLVAVFALDLAHVLLEYLVDGPAVGVPEHHARGFFLQVEEVELLADLAVVAFFGFFDALDVGRQLLLVSPGGAVHALQLLVLGIAAPVGARQLGQLECLEEAGVRHVRATAHVDVFFVVVQAHGLLVGHVLDQAQLVVFATGLEHVDDFGARGHLLDDVVVLLDQLLHALFDSGQVFRGEGALVGDVVVEAFVDDRADDHLGGRVQLLHRVADQVGARVTDDLQSLFIFRGDDLQLGIVGDQVAGIDQLAIDFAGQGGFSQACTDRRGNVGYGNGVIERALAAIGKSNNGHGASSPSGDPYQRSRGLG